MPLAEQTPEITDIKGPSPSASSDVAFCPLARRSLGAGGLSVPPRPLQIAPSHRRRGQALRPRNGSCAHVRSISVDFIGSDDLSVPEVANQSSSELS